MSRRLTRLTITALVAAAVVGFGLPAGAAGVESGASPRPACGCADVDGGWSPAPERVADPQGTPAALIATFDGTTWTPETAAPASGGAGGAHAPPTGGPVDGFGTADGVAADPFGDASAAPVAPVERGVRATVSAGVSGFDPVAPAALLHLSARDVDPTVGFIAPDPLAPLPGTPDVANGFAAHGNTPTTLWDSSGLRPNYGEGSRHGLLGQVLEVAAWVPGLDTFADIGLCALEVGSAVGGDGDMALLAASCASVLVVGVGAGAARASVHGYRAVNKALDARRGADKLTDAGRNTARRQPPARPCVSNSFTGDTEVLMGDGTRVPIRDVKVGDEVVASDPTTGTTGVHAVSALIVGAGVKDMVTVTVATEDGERHELEATGGHPFWVENRRAWVNAADLEVGDVLVGAGGEQARVAEVEQRRALLRVHNLTVDGPHTYHVAAGDTAVLVHNSNPESCAGTLRGTNAQGVVTSRSSFRRATTEGSWNNAKPGPNGGRLCPTCEREVTVPPGAGTRDRPRDWDNSHNPSWTNREFPDSVTRKEVLDDYNRGVGLECATCNRSGQNNDSRF